MMNKYESIKNMRLEHMAENLKLKKSCEIIKTSINLTKEEVDKFQKLYSDLTKR